MLTNKDLEALAELINSAKVGKLKLDIKYKAVFSLDKLNYSLNFQNLIYPYIRLNNYKNTTSRLDLIEMSNNKHLNNLETRLSNKSILYRLAKGDTLMMDSVDVFDENVRSLTKLLSKTLIARVSSNLYYTFKSNVGINLHFDQHDVLALQVHGRKKWNFVSNIIGDSSKSIDLSFKPVLGSKSVKLESFYLEEGEFLFVPKGIWHYTETDDVNSSLHITFGLHPPRKIDLIDSFIRSNFNDSCEENVYGANFEKIKSILSDFINEINTKEIEFDEEKIQDFLKNNIVKYTEVELT